MLLVAGVRLNRPATPRPWLILAAGLVLISVGDWTWTLLAALGQVPFPSIADAFYLSGAIVLALGMLDIVRHRVPGRHLEQRPERGDADPTGDEQHPRAGPPSAGERAVRTFEVHRRADRELLEPVRVVAQILDRDPQPDAVGRGRDRERMTAPPTAPGEEATDEVLARTDRQPVEIATGQVDRHDAGSFADDVRHAQAVAQR